jgi:hypothetical protein
VQNAPREQRPIAPEREPRNRKGLRSNPFSDWELRVGRVRVFYEVDTARGGVSIVGVGIRKGNRLTIGGREIERRRRLITGSLQAHFH